MPRAFRPVDPRVPSIAGYAVAHFGKSLWWNGSELFLAFYLTEHLRLTPLAAGAAIAVGLVTGAAFDLLIGAYVARFAAVGGAARMQLFGAAISAGALMLIGLAFVATPGARLAFVVGANVVYRFAYALYDLPQNCILSLTAWTVDQRRRAASARTVAGALALLFMATLVSMDRPWVSGRVHAGFAVLVSATALLSAAWLWWENRFVPDEGGSVRNRGEPPLTLRWPLALMALVCLTSPAFSKLAPYLVSYSPASGVHLPLILIGVATVASQPAWIALVRRWNEVGAGIVAAGLMIVAAAAIDRLWLAAVLVGIASGGFGTVIWSGFAIAVAGQDPSAAAPAFARLTAVAKLALAVAAVGIGAILDAANYRHHGAGLLPYMRALILTGGIVTGAYLLFIAWLKPGRHAGSA